MYHTYSPCATACGILEISMYLETSKDILNLSLAVSVFGLAFLIGWMLVYGILIIRRLVNLLGGIEERMRKIDDFLVAVREKLEHSASYLSVVALGVKELVQYLSNKRTSAPPRKSRSTQ